jgi:U3 small nucleolar RNA-associated protein 23
MRHGRAKATRRTLQFFARTCHVKPPYRVLLDGTFVVAITKACPDVTDRLDKLLQHAEYHLCVINSVLQELELLRQNSKKRQTQELIERAIEWAKRNCETLQGDEEGETASNDDKSRLGKAATDILRLLSHEEEGSTDRHDKRSKFFFCASQDEQLLTKVRDMGTVPVIRWAHGSVLLLEPPSKQATGSARRSERHKWTHTLTEAEKDLVDTLHQKRRKEEKQQQQQQPHAHERRKRKAKGPNPLSCKKKKTAVDEQTSSTTKRKRRRRHNKSGGNEEAN